MRILGTRRKSAIGITTIVTLAVVLSLTFVASSAYPWAMPASRETSKAFSYDTPLASPFPSKDSPPANLTFFDVGHGDCSLIQYGGECILVDTGKYEDHIAQRLIEKGISKIDYAIITHPHPDHIGGLQEIQKELEIGKIITDHSYDGAFFKVIKPLRKYEIENDNSLVVVFFINDKVVVIPGDNEFESQKELCTKFKLNNTPIYLLKYPHHGVDDFPLFTKIKAEIVVISAGTDGCRYHIPEYVIGEQERNGSKVYWTAHDATIEINLP